MLPFVKWRQSCFPTVRWVDQSSLNLLATSTPSSSENPINQHRLLGILCSFLFRTTPKEEDKRERHIVENQEHFIFVKSVLWMVRRNQPLIKWAQWSNSRNLKSREKLNSQVANLWHLYLMLWLLNCGINFCSPQK